MSVDQIASEALRLPPKERALLAEWLWESLADPSVTHGQIDDDAVLALASERDRQIESGEVQTIPQDDMMARLRR